MAKKKYDGVGADFEVHDAYHTLRHAHSIIGNKGLMRKVKAHHQKLKASHAAFDSMADHLVKMGRISTKALSHIKTPKIKKQRRVHG